MNPTILLVDDHLPYRDGLRSLLDREVDLDVVGEAPDGPTALTLASDLRPDLVLMDLVLGDGDSGLDVARRIVALHPATRILVLSIHPDRRLAQQALAAGAHGYIAKDSAPTELLGAIRSVLAGTTYRGPSS